MFTRLFVVYILLGFVAIAGLMPMNHHGFAIKVTNYLFGFVVLVVASTLFKKHEA